MTDKLQLGSVKRVLQGRFANCFRDMICDVKCAYCVPVLHVIETRDIRFRIVTSNRTQSTWMYVLDSGNNWVPGSEYTYTWSCSVRWRRIRFTCMAG